MRARITLREIPTYLERYSYNRMESGLNARRDMAKINRSLTLGDLCAVPSSATAPLMATKANSRS